MICPYCSTDMEPIELNGKVFCSNCGLSVNGTMPAEPVVEQNDLQISRDGQAASLLGQTNQAVATAVDEEVAETQKIEDGPKLEDLSSMLSPITNEATAAVLGEDTPAEAPVSATVGAPISTPELPKVENTDENTEPAEDSIEPEMVQPKAESESGILMDILNKEPDDIRVLTGDELQPKAEIADNLQEKIKNVEELGTAGILLDILSDDSAKKSKENEISTLEATTELFDKLRFSEEKPNVSKSDSSFQETPKGASEFRPAGSKKLKVDILDDSIVNPVTHLEIEGAEEELDLPLPPKNIPEETMQESNVETTEPKTDIEQAAPVEIAEPEEIKVDTEKTTKKDPDLYSTFVETIPEDLPSEEQEEALVETPGISEEKAKSIAEIFGNKETEVPEKKLDQDHKTEHLKNYFSNMINESKPSVKVKAKKDKKKKTKIKKEKPKLKKGFLVSALILIFMSFTLAGYYFWGNKLQLNSQKVTKEISLNEDTEAEHATLPNEIPFGYEKDITVYDSETGSYTTEYLFTSDNSRKLILKEEKTTTPKEVLNVYTTSQNGKYQVKTINEREYTIFDNGSIAWTKKDKLFTITAVGETYKDLVEKMAISME